MAATEGEAGWARVRRFVVLGAAGVAVGVLAVLAALVTVPQLLGWQSLPVGSGSMSPAIRPGDVVLADPSAPWPLPAGEVITFRQPGSGVLVTHRVVAVDRAGHTYTTRGDANPAHDTEPVPADAVLGRVRMVVPFAGLPTRLPAGLVVPLLLTGLAATAAGAVRRHRAHRRPPARRSPLVVTGLVVIAVAVPMLSRPSAAQFTATTGTPFSLGTGGWSAFTLRARALGPVSYWPLDESTGSSVADVTGSNPMTYISNPTLGLPGAVTGYRKTAVGLTGSAQGAATAADPASLNLHGPISVMAWAKLPSGGTNTTNGRLVARYAFTYAGGVSYMLALDPGAGTMRFLFDLTAGTPSRPIAGTPAPADNAWHFYVGTWDGSTARIYRDGVLGGSTAVTGAGQLVSPSAKVTIGSPGFNESVLGQVDEVAIWDRALTASEISSLYAAAASP